MKNVVLTRIDDRLIHGQVMTSWLNFTSANKIMVIDDQVAGDAFMKSVLKTCVPANIKLAVFDVDKAATRLKKGFADPDRVIILVKFPETLYRLTQQDILFGKINIGGMGAKEGRCKFYKNISASDAEKQMLKAMIQKGNNIAIQIIAEDNAVDVAKLLQ